MAVRGNYVWENKFQTAYKLMSTEYGLSSDPDDPEHFYDYRALFKETGSLTPDATGHFPSKFKLEGHPNMIVDGVDTKTGESEIIGEELADSHENNIIGEEPLVEDIPSFENTLDKINYYQEKVVWLEGIADEKGGLDESGYDAYRYAISQHNKFVDEYNALLPEEAETTSKTRQPRAMQRIGTRQRQRGIGEVPEYEFEAKDMPASVKLIDNLMHDWFKGATKGIPTGLSHFAESFAGLIKEQARQIELESDPEYMKKQPQWHGVPKTLLDQLYAKGHGEKHAAVGKFLNETADKMLIEVREYAKKYYPSEDASYIEQLSNDLHSGGVSLAGAIGFGYLTKSNMFPAIMFGLSARGKTYLEATEHGVPHEEAQTLASMHQANESISEFIGLEFLLTKLPVAKGLNFVYKGAGEYVQEYWQGWFGNMVEKHGWNKAKMVYEGLHREGSMGFWLGGGVSTIIDSVSNKYDVDPSDVARAVEKVYQETLNYTEDMDFQMVEDSTEDYTMDIDVTSTEKYDKFLEQSTEEILDQIDEGQDLDEIPEQFSPESEELLKKAKNVSKLAPDTVSDKAIETTATEEGVESVGTPAIGGYGLQVSDITPPVPPVRERKEWEPVGLPPVKANVAENLIFKEPILTKWYTPKLELMRQMGVEEILGNLPEARALEHMKRTDLTHEVNELIKKINKGRPLIEKFGTWLTNKPSKQVAKLRDLLNTYEHAPDFLTFNEKILFNEVRDLTRNLLKITNEFRVQAGLTEINNLEAYIPHFLDEISRAAANGLYPYVADVYRWTGKKVPKRSTNPTARHRTIDKVTDDLNEVFSKDLSMLLKAMIKYDLRDIYLAIPYAQVRANIDSLRGKIPTKVLEELESYIEYDVFDHQTDLDKIINLTIDRVGITKLVNFCLKPFGRVVTNPVQLLSSAYRQGLMGGAIAGKPRIVLRNLFQRLLVLDFVAPIDFAKAQFYAPDWQMEAIRNTTFYRISVQSFEDLPPLMKPVQWGMYPFQKSHAGFTFVSNIDVAMRAGWWSGQRKIDWSQSDKGQAEIKEFIAKRPWLTEQQKENLAWRDGDQIKEAVEIGSYTQWTYFSTEMPRVFRGQGARAFWSLQSWWMNYFGKHVAEMSRRTFKGMTGRGRIVPRAERWRALKGLGTLFAMLLALKKATGIDMLKFALFPFPSLVLPHAGQMLHGTYKYLLALFNPEERESAWSKLKQTFKLLIPFSGAWKRYTQMLRGDISIKEWLFYMENNNEWKQIWVKDKKKPDLSTGDFEGTIGEEGVIGDGDIIGEQGLIGEE